MKKLKCYFGDVCTDTISLNDVVSFEAEEDAMIISYVSNDGTIQVIVAERAEVV